MWYQSKHKILLAPEPWYDLVADDYWQYHEHLNSFEKWFFLRLLPKNTEELDIVDIWAWDWRLAKIFQGKNIQFKNYTAIDISQKMLNKHPKTQNNDTPITKIKHNLEEKLPIDNESIDIAFSFFVLEHIKDIDQLFSEVEKILKPGWVWIIGYFIQRREFVRKIKKDDYKIISIKYRIQDLEEAAHQNLLDTHKIPIKEKGILLGHLLVCEKK